MSNWTFREDDSKVYKYSRTSRGKESNPYKFKARLRYIRYSRGRSAVTFWFEDMTSGKQYPMFASNFHELLLHCSLDKGVMQVPHHFEHVKKGQSIGIKCISLQKES